MLGYEFQFGSCEPNRCLPSMCGLSECEVRVKVVAGVVYLSVTLCRVRMSGLAVWSVCLCACVTCVCIVCLQSEEPNDHTLIRGVTKSVTTVICTVHGDHHTRTAQPQITCHVSLLLRMFTLRSKLSSHRRGNLEMEATTPANTTNLTSGEWTSAIVKTAMMNAMKRANKGA